MSDNKNRPAMQPREKDGTLFSDTGPTGWGRIKQLPDKGERSEKDFRHLHDKIPDPEEQV